MYPDSSIPAIVSEELWDRANALYKRRSEQMMAHQSAAEFHNRYPYSGKIICEEHGTSFHRQVLKSAKGGEGGLAVPGVPQSGPGGLLRTTAPHHGAGSDHGTDLRSTGPEQAGHC